jgi:ribosome-binding ATPase YchF (GTP1/OBG family)
VLIHVVDASGTADMEGNVVGNEDGDGVINKRGAGSHPLADLAWVRNELIEWVYFNLASKWSRVVTKGPTRVCIIYFCPF